MAETHEISFTIGEQTHGIVRREKVRRAGNCDSSKEFYENAVRDSIRTLERLGAGGQISRDLIYVLDNIGGIQAQVPADHSNTYLLDGEVSDTRPRVEVTPEILDTLSAVSQNNGLSRSEIIRRCVYQKLSQLVQHQDVLPGWRGDEIHSTWEEAKVGLQRPKLQCYDILTRRFVDELDATSRKIQAHPSEFERFADEYTRQYHGTECYNQLIKRRSGRAFSNIESLIEEHTDQSIPDQGKDDGFLTDILQEEGL